jgi:hypothetical protein
MDETKLTTQSQNPIKVFQDDDKRNWTWANPKHANSFQKLLKGRQIGT